MPTDSAPIVDAAEIIGLVGSVFYGRGKDYARRAAVRSLHWESGSRVLTAMVQGTKPRPYRCTIVIGPASGGRGRPLSSTCTCPVGFDCKHVAATLIESNARQLRESASSAPVPAAADWRELVKAGAGAGTGGASVTPIGLLFELRQRVVRGWNAPRSEARSAQAHGTVRRLGVRPVVRSASGNWVRSGVSWSALAYLGNRFGVDPVQLSWFRQFSALNRSSLAMYSTQDPEWIELDGFPSSLLWRLLEQAEELGIPFVTGKNESDVELTTAIVRIDIAGQEGGLKLSTELEIGGRSRPLDAAGTIGDHGVYAWESSPRRRFWLAPLPRHQAALLRLPRVSAVPAADVDEFMNDHSQRLRRRLELRSTDPMIRLPDIVPPTIVVAVTFEPGQSLSWVQRWEGLPDEETAQRMLEPVWAVLPASAHLVGIEAAQFVTETLPRLEQLEVRVDLIGERPDYRLLTEPPRLVVSTVETEDRDWFDLGVTVTVEGRAVPFVTLFTALSRGQMRLLLADDSYLSLEQPVFDELRRLIAEAASLGEWETGLRINRYQASLWSEFEDLADETEQAESWRKTASGLLRGVEPVPQPEGLRASLRPYQREGFDWLVFLWSNGLGGILADDMGLGKTVQTLALVAHAAASGTTSPFLVVAPTSVVANWYEEAARFAPGLTVRGVTATQAKSGIPLAELAEGADIVVTSYALFRIDFAGYRALDWAGLVLDEAQFVKNPAAKAHEFAVELPAPFKLAITGTPLENSLMDLWSLLHIVAPGMFASRRRFAEEYERPIAAARSPEVLARFRRRIRPLLLRRTKELVAAELPERQEQLLRVELSPRHRKLYDTVLQRERQKVLGLVDDLDRNRFIVFRSLTLLRMLSLDAALIGDEHAGIPSAKLEVLLEQMADVAALGHRALVFSQFTSFLRRAADALDAAGIAHEYLDGSTRRRPEVIARFRSGDAPVFLISLKAGGFGLNLTEADYVFLLDPWWNPATEMQAIDRTHRIGQTRSVNVYRLVATGTIEEKVMALRDSKARLFEQVMDEGAEFGSALTADDIRGLLED